MDFVLTIGISIAAAASAVIALFPGLAPFRIPLALLLLLVVAGLTWFGHVGRLLFAVMTVAFVLVCVSVLVRGFAAPHSVGTASAATDPGRSAALAVALAFPVATALATGAEAPSTAIAQLGRLDDTHRRRFGRGTLALLSVVVGGLTLALTALAVRLHIGIPGEDSTQIADIAVAAAGSGWLYGAFQLTSSLLLLAAAGPSFQAGPGLLKALAGSAERPGMIPVVPGGAMTLLAVPHAPNSRPLVHTISVTCPLGVGHSLTKSASSGSGARSAAPVGDHGRPWPARGAARAPRRPVPRDGRRGRRTGCREPMLQ
ncbi:hypothetical protein [Streptomyces sp. NPDC012756]|uniref:hypothetical protein n=1 Tax=Streptomyces sp. NPDC012756 TaxID=3364847 RepID=UPI000E38C6EB